MSKFWGEIDRLAKEAGERLGIKKSEFNSIENNRTGFESDTSYTIMQLRNRVHEQDIEIMGLNREIRDNKLAREMNPAVQDAWDKYQTLLKLTKK